MPHESTHRSKKFQDWDTGYEDYISAYGSESMIDNLPGLFSQTHKAPPPPVIFEATEHNIPMNEAMSNYGNNQMEQEFDPFFNEDFMTYDDPVSMLEEIDPDMLDKIVYQRGMEDAGSSSSMTPWGPTIDQEFMGIAEELLPGLSSVDSLEHFRDAEELLSTYPTELEGLATNIETLAEDQYHMGEEEQIYAAAGDQIAQHVDPTLVGHEDLDETDFWDTIGDGIDNAVEFFKEQGEGTFFPKAASAGIKIESEDDQYLDEDAPFDIGDTGERFKIGTADPAKNEAEIALREIEKRHEAAEELKNITGVTQELTPLQQQLNPLFDISTGDPGKDYSGILNEINEAIREGQITLEEIKQWMEIGEEYEKYVETAPGTTSPINYWSINANAAGHDASSLRKVLEEGVNGLKEELEETKATAVAEGKSKPRVVISEMDEKNFSDLATWMMGTYNLTSDQVLTEGWDRLSEDTSANAFNLRQIFQKKWGEQKDSDWWMLLTTTQQRFEYYMNAGLQDWHETHLMTDTQKFYSEYGENVDLGAELQRIMEEENVSEEEAIEIWKKQTATMQQYGKKVDGKVVTGEKEVPDEATKVTETVDGKVVTKVDGTPEDPRAGGEEGLNMSEDLQKMFYQKMYSQPGAGRWDVQKLLPSLFNQTKALFFLSEGDNFYNRHGLSIFKDEAAYQADENYRGYIEKAYTGYLNKYLTDPMNERAGDKLRMGLDDMSRIFVKHRNHPDFTSEHWTPEDIDKYSWMDGIFGEDESGLRNRDNLVKLNITNGGMGYYSQQIHKSAQKVMDHFRKMGRGEAEIFQYMTKGRRQAEIEPEQIDTETDADIDAAMLAGDIAAHG